MARATRWSFLPMCLMLFCIPVAKSQLQAPIRSFSPSEHGAKRQTWDIAQAPDGTMAFANGAGVLLFDGVRWKMLPSPQGHTVRSVIHHEQSGRWVAGSYDAWYTWTDYAFNLQNPKPTTIAPPAGPKEEWWQIVKDPADAAMLFVQTFSRMSHTSVARQDSATTIEVPGNIMFSAVVNDHIYLPVLQKGLFRYEDEKWILVSDHPTLQSATIVGITELRKDEDLLLATRSGQLLSFHQNKLAPWPSTSNQAWSNSQLNKLLRLKDGGYALATIGSGVFILTAEGKVTAHFTKETGLPDDTVLSLYEDLEGDLWVGLDNGIAQIGLSSGMRFYGRNLGTVYAVHSIDEEHLLIGSNQGLYYCSPYGKTPEKELLSGQIWHITPTAFGTVIGTNDGTSLLDQNGNISTIGALAGGWCWMRVDDTTALAGTYAGIELFHVIKSTWISQGKLDGFNQPIQQLAKHPEDDSYYLANHPQEGLYSLSFDLIKKTITNSNLLFSGPGRLSNSVKTDTLRYFTETATYSFSQHSPPREDVRSPEVYHLLVRSIILETGRLKLWKSGADTSELLLTPNLEYPTVVVLPSDTLGSEHSSIAVGLTRGIGFIDPSHQKQSYAVSKTTLAQNGQKARTVSFTQARFDEAPLWSVRLVGIDSSFSPYSTRSSYSYPFLPIGEYTLEWRNNSGQHGEVFWEIKPYWYESIWATLFYLLLLGLAIWGLRIYYRRRLKEQAHQAEIERERQLTAERLQTRAAELEAEVEISKRTVVLRDAEVEHRNRELARTTMTLVRQNETLLRLKESLTPLPRTGDVGKAKRQSIRLIEGHLSDETDWNFFEEHFDAVHAGFLKKLHDRYPSLTPGDLRLAALLRLNLPSKEIAPLLHISTRGVENKRYRLRKKLDLPADVNLTAWVIDFD